MKWREPRVLRGPRLLLLAGGEHQKTVDPIWPTARGLCLAALPPGIQLEGGADLPPSAPLIGVVRRSIRALCESLMARTRVLVESLAGRHHTAVRQGRGRRGSLRPASRHVKPNPDHWSGGGLPRPMAADRRFDRFVGFLQSSRCQRPAGWSEPPSGGPEAPCRAAMKSRPNRAKAAATKRDDVADPQLDLSALSSCPRGPCGGSGNLKRSSMAPAPGPR